MTKFDSLAIEAALDDELMTYSDLPLTPGNPSLERRMRVLAVWDVLSERNARRAAKRLRPAFDAAFAYLEGRTPPATDAVIDFLAGRR